MNPKCPGSSLAHPFPLFCLAILLAGGCLGAVAADRQAYGWQISAPLLAPATSPTDSFFSVKDPTVVSNGGRWHVFVTVRGQKRSHQVEYISFQDWNATTHAERHFLEITNGYYCAPQVFYFTPHRKWYLLYQTVNTNQPLALQPAISTNERIEDWRAWSPPTFLYTRHPASVKSWIDFWIICDGTRAHLFFTSLNGLMWRAETELANFPHGWTEPQVVLRGDIFEASHTYKLRGQNKYLTLVEAQRPGGRYYKAYGADELDGDWKPIATTREHPFADVINIKHRGEHWTDSISHGELIRSGIDERLEVDVENLRFLFQGVLDGELRGRKYGEIPWRLGLLDAVKGEK